jgi:hypothetical protein
VFALVMTEPHAAAQLDGLTAALGRAGADRVLVCEGANLGAPALDATHGRALLAAAERVPPIVVLFPVGGPGDELGPPLAVRLGAAFGSAVDVDISEEAGPLADGVGRVRLRRWRSDGSGYRQLDPVEIERPVIATLGAHGEPEQRGTADVDLEVIDCPPSSLTIVELASEPDDLEAVTAARGLILTAPSVAREIVARLRAAAPAGVVLVEAASASPAALASSSPAFVLEIGATGLRVGISPRTRRGLIALDGAAGAAAGGATPHDATFTPAREDFWDDVIDAVRSAG